MGAAICIQFIISVCCQSVCIGKALTWHVRKLLQQKIERIPLLPVSRPHTSSIVQPNSDHCMNATNSMQAVHQPYHKRVACHAGCFSDVAVLDVLT